MATSPIDRRVSFVAHRPSRLADGPTRRLTPGGRRRLKARKEHQGLSLCRSATNSFHWLIEVVHFGMNRALFLHDDLQPCLVDSFHHFDDVELGPRCSASFCGGREWRIWAPVPFLILNSTGCCRELRRLSPNCAATENLATWRGMQGQKTPCRASVDHALGAPSPNTVSPVSGSATDRGASSHPQSTWVSGDPPPRCAGRRSWCNLGDRVAVRSGLSRGWPRDLPVHSSTFVLPPL